MRKALLLAFAFLGLCGAQAAAQAQQAPAGKTLLLYYSRSGNTKAACQALAQALSVEAREVRDRNSRDSGLGIIGAMLKINLGLQTDTDPAAIDFGPYARLIVAAPVWASKPALAMKTFLENNRLDGKKVVIFITADSFIEEKYQARHRRLVQDAGGTVTGYFQVQATDVVNGEKKPRSSQKIAEEALKLVPQFRQALAQ
jgi:flavodoxin